MSFPPLDYERNSSKLEKYGEVITEQRIFHPSSRLHKEQREALDAIVKWFSDSDTKDYTAVVVMPTGTGKTGVLCCLPYVLGWAVKTHRIPREELNLCKPILVIAPGMDILYQLERGLCYGASYGENKPFLMQMGFLEPSHVDDGMYFSTYCITKTEHVSSLAKEVGQNEIVLSNSQKWRKNKEGVPNYEDLDKNLFSVVIVDEAHHLPAKQWEQIVQKFKSHAKVIFFTATPERSDGKEITTDGAISTKSCAYRLERHDAIKNKLIRDVKLTNLGLGSNSEEIKKLVLQKVKQKLDEKNLDCPLPNEKKHSAIIITKSIHEAEEVASICTNDLNISEDLVKLVHSKVTTTTMRDKVNEEIKSGAYEVVIIVKMLLEGFDYPPFSVAGIVTRIHSRLKFAQFVGRIQRLVRYQEEGELQYKTEENIVGDIITHKDYKQKELFDYYKSPVIVDEENQEIDEQEP